MFQKSGWAFGVCLVVFAVAGGSAGAQEAPPSPLESYPRAYFAGESAANAYDLLRRVPGFTLVEADEDARGYSAALGNVLIDGARPSSKRESVADVLKRIPPDAVLRIDLLRTGATGVDLAGFPVVANVVRRESPKAQAAVETGAVGATDGWAAVPLDVEYGRRGGTRDFDLSLKIAPEMDDDSGVGRIRTVAVDDGSTVEERLDTTTVQDVGEAAGRWRQDLAGGRLAVAAALRRDEESVATRTRGIDDAVDAGSVTDEYETSREAEVGARYERPLGANTKARVLASLRRTELEHLERSLEDGADETFDENTDSGEDIGRFELSHDLESGIVLNGSIETARNTLESRSRLTEDGVPVVVPGSDVRIAEERHEGSVGATWSITDALGLEAAFRYEWSTITQTGDSPLQRDFAYPKPRVALRWAAGAADDLRLTASREVSQLDFEDFVASASLDTGVVTAGNASLEPEKTWRLAVEWERRFGADAAFTIGWTHDRIEDVIDRVLVTTPDDTFDAPGNIGDGTRDTLSFQLSTGLDALGIPGGRLRGEVLWRESRVTDSVTGEIRGISEEKPVEGEFEFTQDLPRWGARWGVLVEHIAERETKYRFDEIERKSEGAGWTLYVERPFATHWRVHAEVTDLFGRTFTEVRDSYGGPRSDYPLEERETRKRSAPGVFALTFRRSFGAGS